MILAKPLRRTFGFAAIAHAIAFPAYGVFAGFQIGKSLESFVAIIRRAGAIIIGELVRRDSLGKALFVDAVSAFETIHSFSGDAVIGVRVFTLDRNRNRIFTDIHVVAKIIAFRLCQSGSQTSALFESGGKNRRNTKFFESSVFTVLR